MSEPIHQLTPRRHLCLPWAPTFALLAAACVTAVACSGPNLGEGEPCDEGECAAGLQCLNGVCTPQCDSHIDCGDGYRCRDGGQCELVSSAVGDPCSAEIECGPEQTCALDGADLDSDGFIAGTCQIQPSGKVAGAPCSVNDECQTGQCVIGVCTQLCTLAGDCAPGSTCAEIPAVAVEGEPHFTGCLPASGVLENTANLGGAEGTLEVVVPSNARSFAVVAQIDEPDQRVGAIRVLDPDNRILYVNPATLDEFYANPIRYQPHTRVSTLLIPNSPAVGLQVGVYQIDVSSLLPLGGTGTEIPSIKILHKLDAAAVLDVHFYFLDQTDHPCADAIGTSRLDAATASSSPQFLGFVSDIETILGQANLQIGTRTFRDILGRGDLDGLSSDQLGDLLSLSEGKTGINVFFTRSISPVGVQALVGDTPGPPRTPGTEASGIVLGLDTLCYRSWDVMARIAAHSMARHMGLFHNRDPSGQPDTIPDTNTSTDNLLFFGEFGGTQVTSGQIDVLRRYPGLR